MLAYRKIIFISLLSIAQILLGEEDPQQQKFSDKLDFYFGAIDPAPDPNERTELGHQLFFDTRLSASDKTSCVSCHALSSAGTNRKLVKQQKEEGTFFRDIPTVFNVAQLNLFSWEGKRIMLYEKIHHSLNSKHEMGEGEWEPRLDRLASYQDLFKKAYPEKKMTQETISDALAEYLKQLVTPAPIDDYINGDKKALSVEQLKGLNTFNEMKCASCHTGKNFGGEMVQQMGAIKAWPNKKDLGYFYTTKNEEHKMFFRVSPLRNVILTKPYFHDASSSHLLDAIRKMDEHVAGAGVDKESTIEIYTFLKSLSGELPEKWIDAPVIQK